MEAVSQDPGALLGALDAVLRQQAGAAQDDDADRAARLGEEGLGLIERLRGRLDSLGEAGASASRGAIVEALRRLRDLAAYNQLLVRYAFTRWAAERLDRQRRAPRYDARGHFTSAAPPPGAARSRGVL